MSDLTIFLDDGGVMNDNSVRAREWQRLVAEFFAPRLGGEPDRWAAANWALASQEPWNSSLPGETYDAWYRRYQAEWLEFMAKEVGVTAPSGDAGLALAVEAARHVTSNCHSAFPDAVPAIRRLAALNVTLSTASGEDSHELDGYLTCMGVRPHFTHLFGPDLTGAFKRGPDYYDRAFALAGVRPPESLVVDDSPRALRWAAAAGAITVLVDRRGTRPPEYSGSAVSSLDGVVALVERLRGA